MKSIFTIEGKPRLRGLVTILLTAMSILSFFSCDSQIIKDDNGNFEFPKEIEYVHDTILRDYTPDEILAIKHEVLVDTITRTSDILYLEYKDNLQPKRMYYVWMEAEGLVSVVMDSTQVDYTVKKRTFKRLQSYGLRQYEFIE